MFLTPDELHHLTGAKTRPGQIRWLGEHRWRFVINRKGFPIVAREEFTAQLVSRERVEVKSEPRWDRVA